MEIAAKIREIGFKRWYERQLIESHAYLVTCFLSMIAVAVTLEVPSLMRLGFETLVRLAIAFGGIALCVVAWKQYSEWCSPTFWGRGATCTNCRVYAAFNVIGSGTHAPRSEEELYDFWMRVRCRKCILERKDRTSPVVNGAAYRSHPRLQALCLLSHRLNPGSGRLNS